MEDKKLEEKTVMLDNEIITISEFNNKAAALKKNERLVETNTGVYHTIERMYN